MCGRFSLIANPSDVAEFFGLAEVPDLEPRYNIAPSQPVAVLRFEEVSLQRKLALLRWGLVPCWAKDPSVGYKMINARAETVAEKPSFRSAFRSRRCLVMADGFYEWKKDGKQKRPFYIQAQGGQLFAFAGLWERWRDKQAPGAVIETCTIITTGANDLLHSVHDRMPVILSPGDYALWLDPQQKAPGSLLSLLRPAPAGLLTLRPVSQAVNKVAQEGPECIAPASASRDSAGLFGNPPENDTL